jgi:type IV secretion system protein TrbL
MHKAITFILAFCLIALTGEPAFAQGANCVAQAAGTDNSLDQITSLYQNCAKQWEAVLGGYALRLFWLLAAIEFAWAAIRLAFRNADLAEGLAELVNQIFFIGFFFALLINATRCTGAIVDSFKLAASETLKQSGAAPGIAPSDIFDTGLNVASAVFNLWTVTSVSMSLAATIGAFIIVICFALIAAAMIMALVESYIVLSAGVLLLGFGGSRWTKDFALKTVVYAVSVGAKLFMIQLIAGLGAKIIFGWVDLLSQPANDPSSNLPATGGNGLTTTLVIIGSALVLLVLVRNIPDMIQGLINGASLGVNTGLIAATGQLAAAAGQMGRSVYALGMMIQGARELKAEQGQQIEAGLRDPVSAGQPSIMRNMRQAASEHIGSRLSGRAGKHYRAAQMGREMRDEARSLKGDRAEREKRAPHSDAPAPSSGPLGQRPASPPPGLPGQAANENTPPAPNPPKTS